MSDSEGWVQAVIVWVRTLLSFGPVPRHDLPDPSLEQPVILAHQIVGVVNLLINSGTMFLILRRSTGAMREYKKYLGLMQFFIMIADIFTNEVICPMGLFPMPCGYSRGPFQSILPFNTQFAFLVIVLTALSPCIGLCFIYRHQAVQLYGSTFKLSPLAYRIFLTIYFLYFTLFGTLLFLTKYSDSEAYALVTTYLPVSDLPHIAGFACYQASTPLFLAFIIVTGVSGICNIIFLLLLCAHIFYTLYKLTKTGQLSNRMRQHHRRMTKALIIQASLPTMFFFLPIGMLGLLLILSINNDYFFAAAVMIFSLHSSVHSIVTILLTPSYLNGILGLFGHTRSGTSHDRSSLPPVIKPVVSMNGTRVVWHYLESSKRRNAFSKGK